ncbi:MAG: hypothetical protein ACD_80C00211G0007 [uncultured bacterium (gcode 4)]|uniref:Uncharacterized protein n=1 Tax=uncultured bacterium (gcode 4) TaxID=1234023 RepID=K1XGZ1_9BACT|nr:MAG: hypothetical protein ACD_80C00211G0007 [uncultured bacterium (gcode 4)]
MSYLDQCFFTMNDSLQPIDHTLPDNIDKAISNFRKKIISSKRKELFKALSQLGRTKPSLLLDLHKTCEAQVKDTLGLWERKILWMKFNKKLTSYNHDEIIQACKQKLAALEIWSSPNDMLMNMFIIANDLSMYLSSTWRYISRQDLDDIQKIVTSKNPGTDIKSLADGLTENIERNRYSTKDRWKIRFSLGTDIPKIFNTAKYNDEHILTLEEISKVLIQQWHEKLLPWIDQLSQDKTDLNDLKSAREKIIKNESQKFAWYYSVWWKIHFEESIPEEKIEEFRRKFWFQSTSFKLIHANTSLLLPPSCSPNILLFYILALKNSWLLEGEPDFQLSIPGRLPNRAAGILWSAILLSWDTHTEYVPEAFSTTHNHCTWAKIMVYDGWVLNNNFTSNSSDLRWRTDMLGIVDLNTTYSYHFLWSIISQTFYGWKYAKIGKAFMNEYLQLLKKHNLEWILSEERIYDDTSKNTPASSEQHYELIKTITDLQKDNRESFLKTDDKDWLIVFELKNLLNTYQKKLNYKK